MELLIFNITNEETQKKNKKFVHLFQYKDCKCKKFVYNKDRL